MTSNGKRRFWCRGCRKFFRESPIQRGPGKRRFRADMPSEGHMILELQVIAQRLGKVPTTQIIQDLSKQDQAYPLYLYYAVFGSFLKALKRARLKSRYLQEFDEADRLIMLNQLRALSKKLKRPLITADIYPARKRKEVSPFNHFKTAFGTIPAAIELAGVAPKVVYSDEEIFAILRKLDAGLDRPVQKSDVQKLYNQGLGPAQSTINNRFGGIAKARRAAGVKNTYRKAAGSNKYWQRYTLQELIGQLQALGNRLGKRPTDRDINRASKERLCASAETFGRSFGSLPNAYRAAGFENVKPRSYTDNELRAALKKLIKELGRFPGYHDILNASKAGKSPAPGTITRHLGKLTELRAEYDRSKLK